MSQEKQVLQLMQLPGELLLDAEGRWFHAGTLVSHEGIARYFSRHLQWSDEHYCFVIAVAGRCLAVTVADTAYFALAFNLEPGGISFLLNTEERELLHTQPLEVGAAGAWYYQSPLKRQRVKLSRPLQQQLASFVEESSRDTYCLRLPHGILPLQYHDS